MPSLVRLKYRHKIAIIIFAFSILPIVVIGSFFLSKLWDEKVEDILSRNRAQLAGSVTSIDSLLTSYMEKMLYINNNYFINNYFINNHLSNPMEQDIVGIMSFSDYLQSVMEAIEADNTNTVVAIYSLKDTNYDGDYLRSIKGLEKIRSDNRLSLKDEILSIDSGQILWKFRTRQNEQNQETTDVYAYKKMMSLETALAIIELRIPFSQFLSYFQYDIPLGSSIVFDTHMPDRTFLIKSGIKDGAQSVTQALPQLIEKEDSDHYELRLGLKSSIGEVGMYIPRSLVAQELRWFWITVISLFAAILVILMFTVELVSFFLTRKLEVLFRRMNTNVENLINNENLKMPYTDDEFGRMGNIFYELILKTKEYYKQNTAYERERTLLETQLLQERFNPHFLYNTLSTIKWVSKDAAVRNAIDSMVKYYRIALNKGSSIITIAQELELIAEYFRLQQFAYGKEFEFRIACEEELGSFPILKHLLQPVAENAVLHGIASKETGGVIELKAWANKDDIIFEIKDNGVGIDQSKIARILQRNDDGKFGGYGMINIQRKIEVFYGAGYGIEIESNGGTGTTVKIRVPRRTADELQ